MFKTLLKNKKAQNTAEYALLIALVVAGVIAMQTYAQRALQARVRDASVYLANQTASVGIAGLGNVQQYEPYYRKDVYTIARNSNEITNLQTNTTVSKRTDTDRSREKGGFTQSDYNTAAVGVGVGADNI